MSDPSLDLAQEICTTLGVTTEGSIASVKSILDSCIGGEIWCWSFPDDVSPKAAFSKGCYFCDNEAEAKLMGKDLKKRVLRHFIVKEI